MALSVTECVILVSRLVTHVFITFPLLLSFFVIPSALSSLPAFPSIISIIIFAIIFGAIVFAAIIVIVIGIAARAALKRIEIGFGIGIYGEIEIILSFNLRLYGTASLLAFLSTLFPA